MTVDISSVGTTAVITAQMRALESAREDRLFRDDLASELVRQAGLGIENITLDQVDGQRVYVSLSVRTRFLDDRCRRLLSETDVNQVVILGAGLDTRAVRLNWLEDGVTVFEIDRSDVAELKAKGLGIDSPGWRGLAADLTSPSWTDELLAAGFDPARPALFIAEGLFMYLHDHESRAIVDSIVGLSAPQSHLFAVHFGRGALIDAETKAMSAAAGSNGYAFESAIETSPAEWLGPDWNITEATSIAQYAPSVGRTIPYDEVAIGAEVAWMIVAEINAPQSRTSSGG